MTAQALIDMEVKEMTGAEFDDEQLKQSDPV